MSDGIKVVEGNVAINPSYSRNCRAKNLFRLHKIALSI